MPRNCLVPSRISNPRPPMSSSNSNTASQLRGVGPLGVVAIVIIFAGSLAGPIVAAILVLIWARLSHTPMRTLGFVRPRNWTLTIVGGALLGLALKFFMKALVMPLLGAPAINASYHFLVGNAEALPMMILTILVSAGICEEVFFRAYFFERLGAVLGSSKVALTATL